LQKIRIYIGGCIRAGTFVGHLAYEHHTVPYMHARAHVRTHMRAHALAHAHTRCSLPKAKPVLTLLVTSFVSILWQWHKAQTST